MCGLTYTRDIRHTEPNEDGRRRGNFKTGWNHGMERYIYEAATLDELTWQNLGNRLGAILREAPVGLQEEMYEVCVKIQAWQQSRQPGTDRVPGSRQDASSEE